MRPVQKRLSAGDRIRLGLQRWLSLVVVPLWMPAAALLVRFGAGHRIRDSQWLRREYEAARNNAPGGVLICPNHLTYLDPLLVGRSIGSLPWFLRHPRSTPWTVLASDNAERLFPGALRSIAWLLRCIPIPRGGDRGELARSLHRISHLLSIGDSVLIFPEGRRSRSGRIQTEACTYGVGRLLASVAHCRVLCVHVRGEQQRAATALPPHADVFHVQHAWIEPHSEARGIRRSFEMTTQVLSKLAELERDHFDELGRHSLPGWESYHSAPVEMRQRGA